MPQTTHAQTPTTQIPVINESTVRGVFFLVSSGCVSCKSTV
jgi:hypothetical protein